MAFTLKGGSRVDDGLDSSIVVLEPEEASQLCVPESSCSHNELSSSWGIEGRKVEARLMSMWQNMKYGWTSKIRTGFNKEQPIWLLGKCYHKREIMGSPVSKSTENLNQDYLEMGQEASNEATEAYDDDDGISGFKRDFQTRIWMTYRKEFQTMNGTNLTSDCGWGCMLRSGQMLMAQALAMHFLDRSWRYPDEQIHEQQIHRKIISWFGDNTSHSSPFSIHKLVKIGEESGRKAGDWYGPNAVSNLLKQAHSIARQEIKDLDSFTIYVAQNCTIFIQDVMDLCLESESTNKTVPPWQHQKQEEKVWKPLVLLVPLRLGGIKFNPIYGASLKALLSLDNCLGIIGGRPKHSLYFVGYQEDKLIFLDPHYCQDVVDVHQDEFPLSSFHCKSPRKMKVSKMDPCCCVGFYCATKQDFETFITHVEPYLIPVGGKPDLNSSSSMSCSLNLSNYPIFVFSEGSSADREEFMFQHFYGDKSKNYQEADEDLQDDDDDFEFVIV